VKTTLDLDDDLLIEAKTLAIRRKTTLKAIVESALRREVRSTTEMENPDPEKLEVGPLGLLILKRRSDAKTTTSEDVRRMQKKCDEDDCQRTMRLKNGA
jgi:hypothetical protein